MRTILLVDGHYIAHRAFYSTSRRGMNPTGVLYGFTRDVKTLIDRFNPDNIALCFDHGENLRRLVYPDYKANRKRELNEVEAVAKDKFERDIRTLKYNLLPDLGFKNICFAAGYEADDVIAELTLGHYTDSDIVIASADQDLYQLLLRGVVMFNPRSGETMNRKSFRKKYEIRPTDWAMVKAIAGCSTDNIKGIDGVGETTAIQFLLGRLTDRNRKLVAEITLSTEQVTNNLKLVELPFEGCPTFHLAKQPPLDEVVWRETIEQYAAQRLRESL